MRGHESVRTYTAATGRISVRRRHTLPFLNATTAYDTKGIQKMVIYRMVGDFGSISQRVLYLVRAPIPMYIV